MRLERRPEKRRTRTRTSSSTRKIKTKTRKKTESRASVVTTRAANVLGEVDRRALGPVRKQTCARNGAAQMSVQAAIAELRFDHRDSNEKAKARSSATRHERIR